jgi:hypothetical protein
MHRSGLICLAVLAAFPMTLGAAINNPKLDSGEKSIIRVCVVPIEAEWAKVGIKAREGMAKEADEWTNKMEAVVLGLVREAGAETFPALPDPEHATEAAKQTVLQVSQKYDTVATQLHRKPKEVRKGRYTLGDEVALLPCSAKADALLFLHSSGSILTGGKKAFGMLVGGQSSSTARLYMAFVDAKSGEVLAFTTIMRAGDKFRKDPEAVYRGVLTKDFQKMRIGTASTKKK